MLVLNDLDKINNEELKKILMEFRKAQVSRYPLELKVGNGNNLVGFVDSRFPTDRYNKDNMTAMIWWEQEVGLSATGNSIYKYTIESRLIRNEKYASHNSDFHTRKTTDPKKLFKFIKEYAKPFSYQEVAMKTMRGAENTFSDWKSTMQRKSYSLASIGWTSLMDEVVKLHALGVKPQTPAFQKLYEEGIPAYEAYKEVENNNFKRIHVFAHTDGTVAVSSFADYAGIEKGSILYEEMSNVPQHIQEQVGMLRMMAHGDFVPNIGMKINDREFWVEGLSQ